MASVMAIVSKAIFGAQASGLGVGDVWGTDRYVSTNKRLAPLAEGGTLFLVTVRAGDELWLVGALEEPKHDGKAWVAAANGAPIRVISDLLPKLVLANGKGITPKPGKLGMSLQSPRVLAEADVALLTGSTAAPPKKKSSSPSPSTSDQAMPGPSCECCIGNSGWRA